MSEATMNIMNITTITIMATGADGHPTFSHNHGCLQIGFGETIESKALLRSGTKNQESDLKE